MTPHYRDDLAYIHHSGFSEFAESAAPGLLEMLWRRGIVNGTVVELGCGSGILARELTHAGFHVRGFDPSPSMVALARTTAPSARFDVAAFDAVEIPECEAIVAMGEVLNYGTFADVQRLVRNAAARTRLLIFDLAERGAYPPYDERRIDGDDWSVIVVKVSDGSRLTRRILTFRVEGEDMRRDEEVHELELFDRNAMRQLLREHGFRVTVRRSYGTRRLPEGHAVYVAEARKER